MKLLIECRIVHGAWAMPLYRAWLIGERELFELPGVDYIFGYAKETADRMDYPQDVSVRFAYGSITVPRDQVQIRTDFPQVSLPVQDERALPSIEAPA